MVPPIKWASARPRWLCLNKAMVFTDQYRLP